MKRLRFSRPATFALIVLAIGLCILLVQAIRTRRENARIATAPRISAEAFSSAYQKHSAIASKQFDHKLLVLTGIVSGKDEGLLGDGAIHMACDVGMDIQCDVGDKYGGCSFGRECTVVGMCEGMDTYGGIRLSVCCVFHC